MNEKMSISQWEMKRFGSEKSGISKLIFVETENHCPSIQMRVTLFNGPDTEDVIIKMITTWTIHCLLTRRIKLNRAEFLVFQRTN